MQGNMSNMMGGSGNPQMNNMNNGGSGGQQQFQGNMMQNQQRQQNQFPPQQINMNNSMGGDGQMNMMPPQGSLFGNSSSFNPYMMGGMGQGQTMGATQQQENQINQKYKTEKCRHFEQHGNCSLGDRCHFAHGDAELRKPDDPMTPQQHEIALKSVQQQNCNLQSNNGRGGRGGMQFNNQRGGGQRGGGFRGGQRGGGMGMRGNYQNNRGGDQNYGGRGGYNNRGGGQNYGGRGGFNNAREGGNTGSNYKTVLCRHFQQYGSCKYDKCSYAHGEDDLRVAGDMGGNQTGMPSPNRMPMPGNQFDMNGMNMNQNMMQPNMYGFDQNMMSPMMSQMAALQLAQQPQEPNNKQMLINAGMMQGFPAGMSQQMAGGQPNSVISQPQPIQIKFKTQMEGSTQMQENTLSIKIIDQSTEVQQKVQEGFELIQNNDNQKALQIFQTLMNESKIQYQIQSGIESGDQNGSSPQAK